MDPTHTPPLPNFLEHLRIRNAGPFDDFEIPFHAPVTPIAGPNASGKTTILLAASSAYNPNHSHAPGLFDPLLPHKSRHYHPQDPTPRPSLHFTYRLNNNPYALALDLRYSMTLATPSDPDGCRPDLPTYIKTLSHLSSILQDPDQDPTVPEKAAHFVNRTLDRDYALVETFQDSRGHPSPALLPHKGPHVTINQMSHGEWAVTRLAYDLTRFTNGLALIDQIETGLDLSAQRNIMKEIQDLSRTNRVQFIITTHSPEIMAAVPLEHRTFLRPDPDGNTIASTYGQT